MPSVLPSNKSPNAISKGPSVSGGENSDDEKPSLPPTITTLERAAESVDNNKQISTGNNNNNKEGYRDRHPESEQPTALITRKLDGYVGFANLPNQIHRASVKKGFEFTLMVVGESGLGKSTLINSLFLANVYSDEYPGPSQRAKKTVAVESTKVLLKENGVDLKLTVVDTPGFGESVDNSNSWVPIVEYIDSKYQEFLNAETRVTRHEIPDNRVHCCLYFIAPTGHGLKPLDTQFMKCLHEKVNIVPILAKADSMTPDECADFKKEIMSTIAKHKINIYSFPEVEEEDDNKVLKIMRDRAPFAVVGANTIIDHDGKKVLGRKYPWGVVDVENLEHSDFLALRNMVIRTHLNDLKDVTNNVHYENFRIRALTGGDTTKIADKNPLVQLDEQTREHEKKMEILITEMEEALQIKVQERRQKLKDLEKDYQRLYEQRQQTLKEELRILDEKTRAFENEKSAWEQQTGFNIEELRKISEANSKAGASALSMGSVGGGDTLKGSRRLGNLLRRQTSVKSLCDSAAQLTPVIQHFEHV